MLYLVIFVQDGGWEIVWRFHEIPNGNAVYNTIIKPLTHKANRVYEVYPDSTCRVLKGVA